MEGAQYEDTMAIKNSFMPYMRGSIAIINGNKL